MTKPRRINIELCSNQKIFILFIFVIYGLSTHSQEYVGGYGNLTFKGKSAFGKKYGKWIAKGTNGKTYQTQFYKNGIPDSTWITYYPDGRVRNRTKYCEGKIIRWVQLVNDSVHFQLTSKDSIPELIVNIIRKLEDHFQFQLYTKNTILEQAAENGYYAKDKFHENPLWANTIESDIYSTINYHKGSLYFKSWDSNQNLSIEINYIEGLEATKQEYEYKKALLSKKTYYEKGIKVKTEKYKSGQLVKTNEKNEPNIPNY